MADFSKFRTALNGFNRADVTDYIEALCMEHRRALAQAQEEARDLHKQLEETRSALDLQIEKSLALEAKLEETETALQSTETALDEAMSLLVAPAEETPAEDTPDYGTMELEAYRRAEAMERMAAERTTKMNQQLSEMLDRVASRYEQTGTEIQALTEDIRTNLKRLEESLSDLDVIFDETTQSFNEMDPGDSLPLFE